jgi:mRNA (guanine-N7-)-methyltransferase
MIPSKRPHEFQGSFGNKHQKIAEEVITRDIRQEDFYEGRRNIPAAASRVEGVRKFNNWVKSVLFQNHTQQGFTVLDLCCGKGGDIGKFNRQKISFYVGVDMSKQNLIEARERFQKLKCRFDALLICGDVADPETSIEEIVSREFSLEYDLVSCQFALNYIWKSEENACRFFENVSKNLKPGGVFIGTIPDAQVLVTKLRKIASNCVFGNEYYSVKFDRSEFPVSQGEFGLEYGFYLEDSIGDKINRSEGIEYNYVPEYLITKKKLQEIAEKFGLKLIKLQNFHEFYVENKEKYEGLLKKFLVGVVLDEEQWDITYLYSAFIFQKEGKFISPPKHSHSINPDVKIRYMREIEE